MGPAAYRFVDFLAETGQRIWQVLPLVPPGEGDSPYSSPSTFAGSTRLISPEQLLEDGFIQKEDLPAPIAGDASRADFGAADRIRIPVIEAALQRFKRTRSKPLRAAYEEFRQREIAWLDEYALFVALKEHYDGAAWGDWPAPLAHREPAALARAVRTHREAVERERFAQFLFDRQWAGLHRHARQRGVQVLGDLPIYVANDSADVWANSELFDLDEAGRPAAVAGVPPDYFSETGQLWGNPLYRWDVMQRRGFRWWKDRLARTLRLVDRVRLDHFRGFEAYWAVPAGSENAIDGVWVEGPRENLFDALETEFGSPLPLVAEDLGVITPGVRDLMQRYRLPGMVVLEFGFGTEPGNEYLPHHYPHAAIAYTGTHDNDTVNGWWASGTTPEEQAYATSYLRLADGATEIHWEAIHTVMASVCDDAVIPMQDVLGLGSEARMNMPGSETGNWGWRFTADVLSDEVARRLQHLTSVFGRAPAS
jgi:4-alpha-glucanotransferase